MRGKLAKELRRMANYSISYDPEVKNTKEYRLAKHQYKILKKVHKSI